MKNRDTTAVHQFMQYLAERGPGFEFTCLEINPALFSTTQAAIYAAVRCLLLEGRVKRIKWTPRPGQFGKSMINRYEVLRAISEPRQPRARPIAAAPRSGRDGGTSGCAAAVPRCPACGRLTPPRIEEHDGRIHTEALQARLRLVGEAWRMDDGSGRKADALA